MLFLLILSCLGFGGFRDGAKACGSGVTAVRGSEILGLGLTHTII